MHAPSSFFANHDPAPRQASMPGGALSQAPPPDQRTRNRWRCLVQWFQKNTFAPRWLPEGLRHPVLGYLAAALIEIVTASVVLLLIYFFPSFAVRGMLMEAGVVLIALSWGAGPGLCATLVGAILLWYTLLPPSFSWSLMPPAHAISLVLYALIGVSISVLASRSERARQHAEEMNRLLAQAQARSASDYQRLRTVLDVLPSAVAIANADGQILEVNQATTTLWGEEVPLAAEVAQYHLYRGRWARTGQPLAPEDWTLVRALTRGEVVQNDEIELETPAGQRKVILISAAPIRDEAGAITGAVATTQDITEVRRLEREVADRAQELEAIFEAMTEAVYVYDAHAQIMRINASAREILGPEVVSQLARPLEERVARFPSFDTSDHLVPLERIPVQRILQGEVLTGAQAVDISTQIPDGRTLVFSISGKPLRAPEGAITGAVLVSRDVTERRRLEQEVAEHAAALETIFETMNDGIALVDTHGMLVQTNQAFRALLGVDQHPAYATLPPLERLAVLDVRTEQGLPLPVDAWPPVRLLQGEMLRAVDLQVKNLEGREVALNVSGAPIRDATGHITGGVQVFRDLTERHRLERRTREALNVLLAMGEALVQVHQTADPSAVAGEAPLQVVADVALTAVAKRLAELTQSVLGCRRVSMAAIDPSTRLLRPITVVGLPPDQEQAWWASWAPPRHLEERVDARIAAALGAGELVLLDTRHLPERSWYLLSQAQRGVLMPMRLGGELVGNLFIDFGEQEHEEISSEERRLIGAVSRLGALVLERDRLLRRWAEARANALALSETKAQMDTFLGMASHELKSPLTSLKLSLQLTERHMRKLTRGEEEAARRDATLQPALEQLTHTERKVERLERLVNDLVDVSRIQAGKLDLRLECADLATIVREAVEEQRQAAPDRTICLQFPADLQVPVSADPGRLEQVVMNYLTNALKYSPTRCAVVVGIEAAPQEVRVWVRDAGPGLPAEEQERIWERFHRAKGIEVQSGTGVGLGLGLHICRTIIERHQGQVGVESSPGKGSTFWFTVPRGLQPEPTSAR